MPLNDLTVLQGHCAWKIHQRMNMRKDYEHCGLWKDVEEDKEVHGKDGE